MNKIYMSAAAVLMAMSVGATAALAASTPSITVTNDKNASVEYTYDPGLQKEEKASAEKLFARFTDANSTGFTSHNMTITSVSSNNTPVEVYLKLEAEPVSDEYSVLNYYTFKISDTDGNVIYDADYFADPNDTEKIIPFGTFNDKFTRDVKNFNVEYMIRDSMSHTPSSEDLTKLKVYIASKPAEKATPVTAQGTANTVNEIEAVATDIPVSTEAATAVTAPAATVAPTEAATADSQTITKVCGKDITEGRYIVSGNGKVTIKTKTGTEKYSQTVTDGKVEGVSGVTQFIVTLVDGDEIVMTALPGQDKPSVKFEKTNDDEDDTKKTSATKATAAPKTTSSPKTASKTATNTAAKTTATKTNPKTGEGGVPVAALSMIMLASASAIGGLEIYKRRRVSK